MTVANIEATIDFYTSVLNMEPNRSDGRVALCFGNQRINLHQTGKERSPHAQHPTPGSADICLITESPIDDLVAHLKTHVTIEEGPVRRPGAMGEMTSVYFRDPDANLIEVSTYRTS